MADGEKKSVLTNRRIELSLGMTVNVGQMEFIKPTVGMAADLADGATVQEGYLELSQEIMTQLGAQHAFAATGELMSLLKRLR